MMPVTIISGFLGAGKTTLLNRILKQAPQRLGVLVNDFAAINIDAELVEAVDENRIALANGCVCCTIRDDLVAAALELGRAAKRPERIVIETSGVSNPAAVAEAFLAPHVAGRLAVDGTVCLVDAENFPALDFAGTELAIDQAAVADIVLLNKCDLVADAQAGEVEATLRDALPAMRILRTRRAEVPWAVLSGPSQREFERALAGGRRAHAHGHDFESWAWSGKLASLEAFRQAARRLPPGVLRAKGVLRFPELPGERGVFQLVGKRATLELQPWPDAAGASALVMIGRAGDLDAAALAGLLAEASADTRRRPEEER